ncbi:hypothetical protein WISP_77299 [Willisornis vidua]|uniref:Uncharacterized protein n=1 Tax=Willisornis vidua TaxID=1566151 RepID=A0ABQ9DA33_9PASS|nr:hypothetical protein WISP_77299 [Willisornis vidua]
MSSYFVNPLYSKYKVAAAAATGEPINSPYYDCHFAPETWFVTVLQKHHPYVEYNSNKRFYCNRFGSMERHPRMESSLQQRLRREFLRLVFKFCYTMFLR